MPQAKHPSLHQHHNLNHHHEDGHVHHHIHLHHEGDDFQNEFDLYPEDFLKVISEEDGRGIILDIREKWEREQIRMAGGMHMNMQELIGSIHQLNPNETYYILCSQGIRSSFAARYMLSQGFNHIYNIQSGIFGIYEYASRKKISLDSLQVSPSFDLTLQ